MKYGWKLLFIPLWGLPAAGAYITMALSMGMTSVWTFIIGGIVGLVIGIPAGIWTANKVRRDDPDWGDPRVDPSA